MALSDDLDTERRGGLELAQAFRETTEASSEFQVLTQCSREEGVGKDRYVTL